MPEIAHETQPEFWRPPVTHDDAAVEAAPTMAEVCPRCATEYLYGSSFCHTCGGRRLKAMSREAREDAVAMAGLWQQVVGKLHALFTGMSIAKVWRKIHFPEWLHHLHFDEIKLRVGLSTGSLVAFVVGIGCVAGALLVGLLTARTYVDWQAIQFYRAEWLLAAVAAFVAGVLLKKAPEQNQ